MEVFKYKGAEIVYKIMGDGDPIIFLHGFGLDSRMWSPQVNELSSSHKVITYDLRGFGKSSFPTSSYSHHKDLLALLDHLELESVNVVGHSFGGKVALDFTLEYPERVKSLTLIASGLGGFDFENKYFDSLVLLGKEGNVEELRKKLFSHQMFTSLREKTEVYSRVIEIVSGYSLWHFLNDDPVEGINPKANERLKEISVPVKIVVGSNDLQVQKDIAQRLSSEIKESELIVIPNAGHMVNMEEPKKVNLIISENIL
jgi:pimeloyl-ACP methyl ester carboxylesterase